MVEVTNSDGITKIMDITDFRIEFDPSGSGLLNDIDFHVTDLL